MASSTDSFTTVFAIAGKTYIGTVLKGSSIDKEALNNIAYSLSPNAAPQPTDEEYVYVSKPALVEYTLQQKTEENYDLKWTVTPLVFGKLMNSSSTAHNIFLFKKSDIAFSGIDAESDLIKELFAAYKELI